MQRTTRAVLDYSTGSCIFNVPGFTDKIVPICFVQGRTNFFFHVFINHVVVFRLLLCYAVWLIRNFVSIPGNRQSTMLEIHHPLMRGKFHINFFIVFYFIIICQKIYNCFVEHNFLHVYVLLHIFAHKQTSAWLGSCCQLIFSS